MARYALRMFLGVGATVGSWSPDGRACTLTLDDNPLADHVELPERLAGLQYCGLVCGAVRGALEAASWRVTCVWTVDPLAQQQQQQAAASAAAGAGEQQQQQQQVPASAWEMRLTLLERVHIVLED